MMTNKIAIIVGNGTSRKSIDLNDIVGEGSIYGCNALHRDFDKYDYLFAIDDLMIRELEQLEDPRVIIPPKDERWESAEYNPMRRRGNAGMVAMDYAIRHGNDTLYMLGFDFILEGSISVDNIYKDTHGYGLETHAMASDNYYRIQYLEWFMGKNMDTNFIFVIPDDAVTKEIESENVWAMDQSTFISKLTERE
jgi:hypothetical protein